MGRNDVLDIMHKLLMLAITQPPFLPYCSLTMFYTISLQSQSWTLIIHLAQSLESLLDKW